MNLLTRENIKHGLSWWRIVSIFIVYFVVYVFYPEIVFNFIGNVLLAGKSNYEFIYYLTLLFFFIVIIYLGWPLLEESFQKMKETNGLFRTVLTTLLQMYFTMMVLSIFMNLLNLGSSSNQEGVNWLADSFPRLFLFSSIIFAPVVEEIVFRGLFYRELLPYLDKKYAAVISAILFGLIHIIIALISGKFSELLFLPLYSIMGYYFAKTYEKSQSIFGSILLHMCWNLIAALSLILG